jgi:protein-L-isoaspartate O-methyltransferase
MKHTTERHDPDAVSTIEDRVVDAMHRYAYRVAAALAAPTDRVLDVGFGEGCGSAIVGPSALEYVGVDVEEEAEAGVGGELREEEIAEVGVEPVGHSKDGVDSSIDLMAIARA